jgi:hypothetical protein
VTVSEGIGLALSQVVQTGVSIIETLGLAPTVVPIFTYNRTITERIRLADTLANFFGADLVEGIGFSGTATPLAQFAGTITEGLGLAGTLTPQLVLRVVVTEDLELSDTQALRMLFQPTLTEGIQLSAAYLSSGGGVVTWAMNTRSGAVTEYDNYAFNSFARIGNSYLGASDTGLYELLGDDDAGASIVASIKSGFAQWAGTRLAMFKGVYLGIRGTGDFVLKLVTGDDKTYIYTVNAQSQKTTKVTTGKGLRARYWSFELVSTGQDFDLDTIEFVPVVSDRRV